MLDPTIRLIQRVALSLTHMRGGTCWKRNGRLHHFRGADAAPVVAFGMACSLNSLNSRTKHDRR
jgi:hypothetical protein